MTPEELARAIVTALQESEPVDSMASTFVHADDDRLDGVSLDGYWNMLDVAKRVLASIEVTK